MEITVLALFDRISLFHTLKPFFTCPCGHGFHITDSAEHCLRRDRNRVLIMERMFLKPDVVDYDLLRKLRDKYARIAFLNGNAGGGIHRPGVLEHVDLFFNKSLFRDRSLYSRRLYANELFAEYYHERYKVDDTPDKTGDPVADPALLSKLRLSWNVGIGDFPRRKLRQRAGVAAARILGGGWARPFFAPPRKNAPANTGAIAVHARFGYQSQSSITWQRRVIAEKIKDHPSFVMGRVPQRQFNWEVQNSRIVLSPFGWGELCFRDYEAVQSGALLVKPDMGHLETWPDIFVPGQTYVPIAWDGSDVVEKCEYYLAHEAERRRIIAGAIEAYDAQAGRMCERFGAAIAEIVKGA
jgi:hypothetical protein